ncbi:hypothetical protein [Stakelama marina]|uniref:Uncharacterized protein n=1 Tax=Stakelama marina TaxID=2826939 RepID=A0A8T4IDD8_9SPHN|nr:hypothetical protein [Stakelama marina]MBR0553038.1 hypothetical protein [Stakelama marina]
MEDIARAQLRYRRAALQRDAARADARSCLADALGELDDAGTYYTLYYPDDGDRPDWQGGTVPADFSHLDWNALAPSLEVAVEDRSTRRAILLAEIARRSRPADTVLVTVGSRSAPQLALAHADFERHCETILNLGQAALWLSAPSARWLIELRPPWVRVAG